MAYAVILPGRWEVSNVDVLAVLSPLLFGLWWCFLPFAAFGLGVLVVSGLELVVFLVAARGGRRVVPGCLVPPGCLDCSVAWLLVLAVEAVGLASFCSSDFTGLVPRGLRILDGFAHCFG